MSDPPRKKTSPDDHFSSSEEATLVTCFACGGEWETVKAVEDRKYKMIVCAWCVRGSMTAKQIVKWRQHQRLIGK